LSPQSVDLITVGQALYWFDLERAKHEFDRILKPSGWLALIGNRFGEGTDPNLSDLFLEDEYTKRSFPVTIYEKWPRFIGGARSSASNPSQGDDGYEEFEHKQRKVFDAQAAFTSEWSFAEKVLTLAVCTSTILFRWSEVHKTFTGNRERMRNGRS
jgi:hypothetical protein